MVDHYFSEISYTSIMIDKSLERLYVQWYEKPSKTLSVSTADYTPITLSRSGEVYSIQHYVIKFVHDLRQVGGFFRVLRLPPPVLLTDREYNTENYKRGTTSNYQNYILGVHFFF